MRSRYRVLIIKALAFAMLVLITIRLFSMQVIEGDVYVQTAVSRVATNIRVKAPRGDILDRYGKVLVTNKSGYSINLQKTNKENRELNSLVGEVADILIKTDNTSINTLPISDEPPYKFNFKDENNSGNIIDEKNKWVRENKYFGEYIDSSMTAEEIIDAYCKIYEINGDQNSKRVRMMVSMRYEADTKQVSYGMPVTVAEDVNAEAVTAIKSKQKLLEGINVSEDYMRVYTNPGFATHVLGRTGQISDDEYEKNKKNGYGINDSIGKQGIEKWAECYLRGIDGVEGTYAQIGEREVEVTKSKSAVPGNYVMLTIDSDIQKTLESSLESTIKSIGNDCDSGGAVVLDVNTGNTLAIASYPTYDMTTFNEDYSELIQNKANPMLNRAVSGLYSPGSTFKPLTAIAGIQSGAVKANEYIACTGIYDYYEDYQPRCWIYSEYDATHGHQNVTQAIENSCNVYFYELGRRLGIAKLDEYAKKFGLGEYTGIQLTEETSGHMASPEYKEQVILNVTDSDWFGGDTLQTAIGQSYSLFTPVQLANYCATVANGGTRYKVNLIDSIRSSVDGTVVESFEPEVVEKIDMAPQTVEKIHDGMKKVVDEGSASSIFEGYPVQIGGKTGTAQLGNGSNNAIFIAFAPFEDPQIAIAVVLEHGVRGTNAGKVARDVFDQYFNLQSPEEEIEPQVETTQTGIVE